MANLKPNYKLIYNDIIAQKYPHKKDECLFILEKKQLSVFDVIELNNIIFGIKDKETDIFNQRHRSYNESTILKMLYYQKKNSFNDTQLANHFKLSRNTIAKWKKKFPFS